MPDAATTSSALGALECRRLQGGGIARSDAVVPPDWTMRRSGDSPTIGPRMAKRSPLRSPHLIEVMENVMPSESDLVYEIVALSDHGQTQGATFKGARRSAADSSCRAKISRG
jgi:hypothetical protein